MSVISLQCPNCNAKLKAKASAVGQSLACPRCANMLVVEVASKKSEDPLLKSFESDSLDEILNDSTASATTEQGSESPEPNSAKKARKPLHPEDLQSTMPAESAGEFKGLKTRPSGGAKESKAKKKPESDTPDLSPSSSKLGPGNWQSQKAKQRQAILLGIVLGLGVLIVGGSLTYYLLTQPTQTAENGGNSKDKPIANDSTGKNGKDESTAINANENLPDDANLDPTQASDQTATEVVEPEDAEVEVNTSAETTDNLDHADKGSKDSSDVGANSGEDHGETNVNETNPIAVDGQDSNDESNQANAPSKESFEDAINQIFGGDSVFQEQTLSGPQSDQESGSNNLFGQVLIEEKGMQRRRSARYERPAERLVDVRKELEVEVAGIKHDQMGPVQFLKIMERLTSVPMWIDAPRLQAAAISLDQSVAVQSIKRTAVETLEEQLPKFGFAFEVSELGIRVFPVGTDSLETKTYAPDGELLADLTDKNIAVENQEPDKLLAEDDNQSNPLGNVEKPAEETNRSNEANESTTQEQEDDPATTALIQLAKQLIQPKLWQSTEGEPATETLPAMQVQGNSITVVAPKGTQVAFQRLLQKLAVANVAVPTQQQKDLLTPRAFACDSQLNRLIRLDYFSPTPLRTVLDGFTNATEVQLIINWPALIAEGWTPDTEIPWIANNETGFEALDSLTFDMGLTYRIVQPGVIELTSVSALNENLDLEIHPVQDLLGDAQQWPTLRSRLSQMLYVELNEYPAAYVNYYPKWNCVIAKLPQAGQRRLTEYFVKIRQLVQK